MCKNVIAATCGPPISFLVGRESDKKDGASMQPDELWAFLEETTRAALIPARAHWKIKLLHSAGCVRNS